jgi:hypothetical protein
MDELGKRVSKLLSEIVFLSDRHAGTLSTTATKRSGMDKPTVRLALARQDCQQIRANAIELIDLLTVKPS